MKNNECFREFLKCKVSQQGLGIQTDREKGLPAPSMQKPAPASVHRIKLIQPNDFHYNQMSLMEAITRRKSRRNYTEKKLTYEELSFLLWATQGVKKIIKTPELVTTRRTVPSGGSCHAFETYILVNRVKEPEKGLYRYLPLEHSLCLIRSDDNLLEMAHEACLKQYVAGCAVAFFWTVIPDRAEWRYADTCYKVLAIEAGHICQNLYLACEAIDAGTCAIGAYDQEKLDFLLSVDGKKEFAVYAATVGKIY